MERHALADVMKGMGRRETVHGFRSSFSDWAADNTAFPQEVREQALAHAIPNKVEAAYDAVRSWKNEAADGRLGDVLHGPRRARWRRCSLTLARDLNRSARQAQKKAKSALRAAACSTSAAG